MTEPATDPTTFSALEDALLQEGAGAVIVERLSWIETARMTLMARLDGGVSPAEAETGEALLDAFAAAETILKTPAPRPA